MKKTFKHYNLQVSVEMFSQVEGCANALGITVADFLRRSIRLGLLLADKETHPNLALIIRENGKEREVILL